jgi:hypothetical protein
VSSCLNFRQKLFNTNVASNRRLFSLEVTFEERRLEVTPLVVENSGEEMPKRELRPKGFGEVENC